MQTPAAADEAKDAGDGGGKGKGKGGRGRTDEEEDIDALLAELEAPKQPAAEGANTENCCDPTHASMYPSC